MSVDDTRLDVEDQREAQLPYGSQVLKDVLNDLVRDRMQADEEQMLQIRR